MMLPHFSTARTLLVPLMGIAGIFIFVNPVAEADIFLLLAMLLFACHVFWQEKLLLIFLLIRPIVDYYRDAAALSYENVVINVNAVMAVLLAAWAGIFLVKYRRQLSQTPLLLPLLCMILWFLLSGFFGVSKLLTFIEVIKFFNIAALFILSYIFVREKKVGFSHIIAAVALSSVIPLLAGILQTLLQSGLTTFDIRDRIYGTFGHPNVLAFFLLSLLILHIHYSSLNPIIFWKRHPLIDIGVYVLLLTLLLLTYTRAAFIGLGIFLIILGVYRFRALLWSLGIAGAIFYLVFFPFNRYLIATANVNLQDIPLIGRMTARNEDADSIAWRQTVFRETIPIIRSRPIIGYGYGTFAKVWEENRGLEHQWDDSAEAHNDYLRLALETGIVGLLLYLLVLGRLLLLAYHAHPQASWQRPEMLTLFGWVTVFGVVSVSDNILHHTPVMWLTWSLWGAMLADKRKTPVE